MKPYLVALHLQHKSVLVVGGCEVATRKIRGLIEAEAQVTVISPRVSETIRLLANAGQLAWMDSIYRSEVLDSVKPILVIAATDDPNVNADILRDAQARHILANNVSSSERSDFTNVATIDRDPIQIGISSGGASPGLVRQIKSEIDAIVDDSYALLAQWLDNIRDSVESVIPTQTDRQAVYQDIVASDVLTVIGTGDVLLARAKFDAILRSHLAEKQVL